MTNEPKKSTLAKTQLGWSADKTEVSSHPWGAQPYAHLLDQQPAQPAQHQPAQVHVHQDYVQQAQAHQQQVQTYQQDPYAALVAQYGQQPRTNANVQSRLPGVRESGLREQLREHRIARGSEAPPSKASKKAAPLFNETTKPHQYNMASAASSFAEPSTVPYSPEQYQQYYAQQHASPVAYQQYVQQADRAVQQTYAESPAQVYAQQVDAQYKPAESPAQYAQQANRAVEQTYAQPDPAQYAQQMEYAQQAPAQYAQPAHYAQQAAVNTYQYGQYAQQADHAVQQVEATAYPPIQTANQNSHYTPADLAAHGAHAQQPQSSHDYQQAYGQAYIQQTSQQTHDQQQAYAQQTHAQQQYDQAYGYNAQQAHDQQAYAQAYAQQPQYPQNQYGYEQMPQQQVQQATAPAGGNVLGDMAAKLQKRAEKQKAKLDAALKKQSKGKDKGERSIASANATVGQSDRRDFMKRTYKTLFFAILAFTALLWTFRNVGFFQELLEPFVTFSLSGRWQWGVVLAAFVASSFLADQWASNAKSRKVQYLGLMFYVVAEAVIFVPLLAVVADKTAAIVAQGGGDPNIIRDAAIMTLAVFGMLTASVVLSKKDFSFLRSGLFVASGAAIGAVVLSLTFGFNLGLLFSVAMVVLAGGYILYQTSQVLAHYDTDAHVAASLALFSSVALMFWYMIRIFMRARD
ncbi:MAG: Bax inhibitor-1 family protein [Deltaproteobacteria bacterium]|nr:Bax inhibitor-1 family protein [Deltaproteobacteria bacterium]